LLGGLDDLIQLNYGWVPDELEDMNLARDPFDISYVHYFLFLEDFDGDFLSCGDMDG